MKQLIEALIGGRGPLFRFFSSVKLAVILLLILIVAAATGTVYESHFNAKVARAYIYEAWWFNLWLLLLAVNVGAAALSRYPWKKRHTGFLITHAGIIILLAGSMIGRAFGKEGTMTLFKGDEPTNRLVIDQKEVRVRVNDEIEHFPVQLWHQKSHPAHPILLGETGDHWKMEVTDYSDEVQAVSNVEKVVQNGAPAIEIHLWNPKMLQAEFRQWLWPDDPDNASLNMELMAVECRRGEAPGLGSGAQSEKITANAGAWDAVPDRMRIYYGENGHLTYLLFTKKGERFTGELTRGHPVATHWADWQINIEDVAPQAVLSTHFVPVGPTVKLSPRDKANTTEALKIRFTRGSEQAEEWLASGWQVTLPLKDALLQAAYGLEVYQLPFTVQLKNFEVERNAGTDTPASFKSTLQVKDAYGVTATGSCSMNEPMSFPSSLWRTWTGFTYKISQASWNPENLQQSSVQILRDPGWSLKWVGSLMICLGIFTMFYLRPGPVGPKVSSL